MKKYKIAMIMLFTILILTFILVILGNVSGLIWKLIVVTIVGATLSLNGKESKVGKRFNNNKSSISDKKKKK